MPEFSACYFCGTALDAPLAEYPVVPDTLHPSADQQRTVVLCPSCRRKLGAVVDTVVAAVDDPPGDEAIQQELAESSDAGAVTPDTEADDGDSGFRDEGRDAEDAAESNTLETEAEEAGVTPAAAEPADESTPAAADETGEETEPAATESTTAGDATASSEDATEAAADADADDTRAPTADEPQLTAFEYNKVMRLLQNRDFPVDHEEFKIVATNAYEIDGDEFDAIIGAAEKRDLIGLEGDQIVDA